MSQRNRHHSSQSRRLLQKLAAYSFASASLTAVEANAAIVHTDLGPDGISVSDGSFHLDLNLDGTPEFEIVNDIDWGTTSSTSTSADVFIRGNHVLWREDRTIRFEQSDVISTQLAAIPFGTLVWFTDRSTSSHGPFGCGGFPPPCALSRGFLALRFESGGTHTAWVDIFADSFGFQVFGFAYESVPGKSILAGAVPEPPSLVLLAAGATGLGMLRRKRRAMKCETTSSGR